ncbi:MAG: UPF0179 family protein [Thermoplasmata archaeon]|nr:UPF0179 family protein [Thermoplasmata archaeon]
MVMLTVIGKKMATPGFEFIFFGPNSDCKECKVKNICFHLEKGTKYRVVGTRNVTHKCPIHEDGVVVVQVEAVPRKGVILKKIAIEGSTIAYEIPKCRHRGCQHYELCFLSGVEPGQKKKLVKVMDKTECIIGQSRVAVMLQ